MWDAPTIRRKGPGDAHSTTIAICKRQIADHPSRQAGAERKETATGTPTNQRSPTRISVGFRLATSRQGRNRARALHFRVALDVFICVCIETMHAEAEQVTRPIAPVAASVPRL